MTISEQIQQIWQVPLEWERLDDANILIAGATGLIGSSLVRVLLSNPKKNYNVYALGRNKDKLQKVFKQFENDKSLVLLEGDVTEKLPFKIDFNYIIDCASNATPDGFKNRPVETILTNIKGVDNLLSYGREHNMRRFLYVSTGEIYGEDKDNIFTENDYGYIDNLNPRSCYPESKRAAENLCVAYAAEYDLDVVIARPCHIYGPYFLSSDDRAYAQFLRKAVNKENIVLNSPGLLRRSWCYVIDCVIGLLYILFRGTRGEAYNISDTPCTIKDFAKQIATSSGVEIELNIDQSLKTPIITQGVLSSDKLKALGWQPLWTKEINISSSLKEIERKIEFEN